ncbi:EamA family transporter [Novosphingobium cyanobacteriorum]|uniref:EamA family transporter n=1 Tax=Novosphingobium cyanobacteriorum TaxID=3024215 RepID=A0ABT6CJ10_9SPHN|nr:EamA family transporter [Novosphingobium cyanobacteriorum]MDF8333533.1 EamA family transporter [Novosphingobium cyanobacteriorum]
MPQRHHLPLSHLLLALAIMVVWGTNFVVIKVALGHLPPLTLALLRFVLVFFPMALFVPRPQLPWRNLAAYGVLIGAGQFGILFTAMRSDITPGLASLVVQTQAFFTIGLAMRFSGERVAAYQVVALLLATAGLATIVLHTDGSATPLGIGLVLVAALSWSGGNMVSRAAGPVNMLGYVVWSALFAVPPLLAFALALEGPARMWAGISAANGWTWGAVAWQSVGNTMFGYAAWGWLLSRHPAAQVAPLALLVPVFGLGASALLLGEPLQWWKITAFALVMAGLALGTFWPRLSGKWKA